MHVYITQSGSLPGPALGGSRLVDCSLEPAPLKPISEEDAVRDSGTFLTLVTENIIISQGLANSCLSMADLA